MIPKRALLPLLLFLSCAQLSAPPEAANKAAAEAPMAMDPSAVMSPPEAKPAEEVDAKKEDKTTGKEKDKETAKPWKRASITPNLSRLMVGEKEELPLQGIQSEVFIDGPRARVLLDLYFYNDRDQRLEGSFSLRLPDGASLHFLAFGVLTQEPAVVVSDGGRPPFFSEEAAKKAGLASEAIVQERAQTWSAPKIAKVVQREQAAVAYRNTVRRNVDPALAEWAGAGVFNAKLFPLEPKKMHRVVVSYDLDLLRIDKDFVLQLDLPTTVKERIVDLSIADIKGSSIKVSPETKLASDGVRRYGRVTNPDEKGVTVTLSGLSAPVLIGQDAATGSYFATRAIPELPKSPQASAGAAVFAVDTSLSSNPDQFNVWLMMLQSILEKNRDSISQFSVVFFNVEAFWWQEKFVENNDANVKALMSFAQGLALEGATDLGQALKQAAAPVWYKGASPARWDIFLLSDGAATWGESDLYALSQSLFVKEVGSLFAYRTGLAGADNQMLEHLTREGGGAVFSVTSEQEVATAATAHRSIPWEIEGVSLPGASDVLLSGAPKAIFPGQELRLVGRGEPELGATLTLNVRQGEQKKTVNLKLSTPLKSALAPRVYGQEAVSQLEALGEPTESLALSFARHFQVVGKSASLLLLESEEDYARFNIKPEDDATKVKQNLVAKGVAETRKMMEDLLADPKELFLAWARRLPKIPGVSIPIPEDLMTTFSSIPSSSFRLNAQLLTCQAHSWEGVSAQLQEQLKTRALDYDALTKEATRRKTALSSCDAVKALSSLVENNPGDTVLARDVGFSAMELGLPWQAYNILRRVVLARPDEPQTYHAIALALADAGAPDLAMAYFEIALAGNWDGRFGDFKTIVGLDYLRFLGTAKLSNPIFAQQRKDALAQTIGVQEADLLITIAWNTDGTDVDLHILEPTGEECFYSHPKTAIGGNLTRDVTQGYGPEMYVLQKAKPGSYKIWAHYFSSDRVKASARTKVYATIFQNWGKPNEKVLKKVVALEDNKQTHEIEIVTVK